jgi:hypothetical protein
VHNDYYASTEGGSCLILINDGCTLTEKIGSNVYNVAMRASGNRDYVDFVVNI